MTTSAKRTAVLPPDYSQGSKRPVDAFAVFVPEGFALVSTGHIQKRDLLLVMPQAVWLFATPSQLGDPVTDFRAVARPYDDAGKVEDCITVTANLNLTKPTHLVKVHDPVAVSRPAARAG